MLGCLTTHPDAKLPVNQRALVQAENSVKRSLAKLEALKPKISRTYEAYEKLVNGLSSGDSQDYAWAPSSLAVLNGPRGAYNDRQRLQHSASRGEPIAASDHKDLAVRLAHTEIQRRALARKATRQAGIPEEVEQERRTGGVWGNWEEALAKDSRRDHSDSLNRRMQEVPMKVDIERGYSPFNGKAQAGLRSAYQYPAIPATSSYDTENLPKLGAPPEARLFGTRHDIEQPPAPPPKEYTYTKMPPVPPRKQPLIETDHGADPIAAKTTAIPTDLYPSGFTFQPAAYLENGAPLRTIFLPPGLRNRFLSIAEPNTLNNLETCGILCGTLISNALFISKLVIPEQESTSDTCETLNETRFFDYVDGEDLMVLGWIHTHPSQTCFMSSRDLHTHSGYQVMIPESIAIVCAPSKNE